MEIFKETHVFNNVSHKDFLIVKDNFSLYLIKKYKTIGNYVFDSRVSYLSIYFNLDEIDHDVLQEILSIVPKCICMITCQDHAHTHAHTHEFIFVFVKKEIEENIVDHVKYNTILPIDIKHVTHNIYVGKSHIIDNLKLLQRVKIKSILCFNNMGNKIEEHAGINYLILKNINSKTFQKTNEFLFKNSLGNIFLCSDSENYGYLFIIAKFVYHAFEVCSDKSQINSILKNVLLNLDLEKGKEKGNIELHGIESIYDFIADLSIQKLDVLEKKNFLTSVQSCIKYMPISKIQEIYKLLDRKIDYIKLCGLLNLGDRPMIYIKSVKFNDNEKETPALCSFYRSTGTSRGDVSIKNIWFPAKGLTRSTIAKLEDDILNRINHSIDLLQGMHANEETIKFYEELLSNSETNVVKYCRFINEFYSSISKYLSAIDENYLETLALIKFNEKDYRENKEITLRVLNIYETITTNCEPLIFKISES